MLIRCSESLLCLLALSVCVVRSSSSSKDESSDESSSLALRNILMCLRREYTLKATRSDPFGRTCWDIIKATSCWGRCDSFEIPDWRFPFKISYHPVCMHDQKVLRRVRLRNCDPGMDPEFRVYEFYEAQTCSCRMCNSSDTFCDWKGHFPSHSKLHHSKHHRIDRDSN